MSPVPKGSPKAFVPPAKPVHQVVVGLEQALWEAGPNPVTDFADALEFEGRHQMPPDEKKQWDALGRFRDALTEFLVGKDAAFIGGVAVRSYGGRRTATVDFDFLVAPALLKEVTSFLGGQGGLLKSTVESTYSFHVEPCRLDVDVRLAESALDKEALKTAGDSRFKGRKLRIVRPEFLPTMKVKAYSERKGQPEGDQDRKDVQGLVGVGSTSPEAIREILKRHRPDLAAELDEILQ
jgi:hypothetical protein